MDVQQSQKISRAFPGPMGEVRCLRILNEVGSAIASDLNLESIVQIVTDAATELTGADFGAFFYNVLDDRGESYLLYALSGAPRSAFEQFGMPRNTDVFDHTFRGLGVVRSDDIREDPRYGKLGPHHGMPQGHLPVTSYLAVPVISRTGTILGGLFLGHKERAIFTEDCEGLIVEVAARASVAIDNANLLEAAQKLASIIESSNDAIISKDLNGTIRSWNAGAERIFGYSSKEAIGQSVLMLIPPEFQGDEPAIVARIVSGERVEHFETVRQRKDGTRVNISLCVSPIRDRTGAIVGASKVARDITDGKNAQEKQSLLVREMSHRVKNLFAVASGVVALSAKSAATGAELAHAIQSRLGALARAHDLTLPSGIEGTEGRKAELSELVEAILSPYANQEHGRIGIEGPKIECGPSVSTSFALLLHEFATNSIKYGALSNPEGCVDVTWKTDGALDLMWAESGGPLVQPPDENGFGGILVAATVKSLGGTIERQWRQTGLVILLTVPFSRVAV